MHFQDAEAMKQDVMQQIRSIQSEASILIIGLQEMFLDVNDHTGLPPQHSLIKVTGLFPVRLQ